MFGILLITVGAFFGEISASVGKKEVEKGKEDINTFVFLNLFWSTSLFALLVAFRRELFIFSFASLPTFSARLILEIFQSYIMVRGMISADRSTFSFIRLLTIPLLLISDLVIGYNLNASQITGVIILSLMLALVFLGKKINHAGVFWLILGAVNAVFTLSLFEYDITHFNSMVAEQLVIQIFLLIFYFFFILYRTKTNPIRLLFKKIFFAQSFSEGISSLLSNFAYGFLPASVATAAVRATAILSAVFFGRMYFGEKHIIYKIFLFFISIIGLFLLAV